MKTTLFLLLMFSICWVSATTISAWNFESDNMLPSTGSGSISPIGGVNTDGYSSGYPSDTGRALVTTAYPTQGTNNRTGGLYIEVSSEGFTGISFSWAIRHSNTSANRAVLYYTLDRSQSTPVWVEAAMFSASSGDSWIPGSFDGTSITAMNNNPNLAFKIVSSFANVANDAYMPSKSTSSYAPSGKWRFDSITLDGTPITPHMEINAELLPFYTAPGTISDIQSYHLTATHVSGNINLTAPDYFYLRIEGTSAFESTLSITPRSGGFDKNIEVVFQPISSGDFSGNIVHTASSVETIYLPLSGFTTKPEPSTHPTSFSATDVSYFQGYLNWNDSTGAILPDAYIIKGSKVGFSEIADPVDGVVEEDKKLTKNVPFGQQTQLIFELNENHPYYFKIFPYTNSGTTINYKTDGTVPSLTFNTTTGPIGSNLNIGDIAFVEYATDSPDRFSFVLLKDMLENTQISFTDKAWTGSAFAETEEVYTWRAVGRSYSKGEVIHIEEAILHPNEGIYNPDFEGFSNSGDQIICFQGYLTEPSFIAAFSTTGWIDSGAVTNSTSYLPSVLSLGSNALGFSTEVDNGYYNGIQSGTPSELLAAINNPNNWYRQNSLGNIVFPDWSFSVLSDVPLPTPILYISQESSTSLRLYWDDVLGAQTYRVYCSANPEALFPDAWSVLEDSIATTTLTLSLSPFSQMFFKVVARD